jgi:hypothetical protein
LRGQVDKNDDFGEQACWSSTLISAKTLLGAQPASGVGKALRGELEAKGMTIRNDLLIDTVFSFASTSARGCSGRRAPTSSSRKPSLR